MKSASTLHLLVPVDQLNYFACLYEACEDYTTNLYFSQRGNLLQKHCQKQYFKHLLLHAWGFINHMKVNRQQLFLVIAKLISFITSQRNMMLVFVMVFYI